jgi:CheY-like chemotaxis protein/DNA-directed RNA polymerase specialized sigma24 family protein
MAEILDLDELRKLRRYAFCLLGNGHLSDIVVEGALNALVSHGDTRADPVSRVDLYKNVNEAARTSLLFGKVSAAVGSGLHARLLRLGEEQRQVAALHAVAGLPFSDVASIMDVSEEHVCRVYAESLLALRDKPMAVLIIEDEAIIAHELQAIVTGLGLSVAGMARNRAEALRIAGASKPQLILADYQLKGDTGVDVVKAIRERLDANVIYVTAHPEAVVSGQEEGDIIIPKPFNVRAVQRAVRTHLAA